MATAFFSRFFGSYNRSVRLRSLHSRHIAPAEIWHSACAPAFAAFLAALVLASVPHSSHAQVPSHSVGVNRYQPGELPGDGFAVRATGVAAHLSTATQVHLDYANDPLVFESRSGEAASERVALVEHQLTGHLVAALGLFDRFAVFMNLPVHLVMTGTALDPQPTATGFGPGDVAAGARVRLTEAQAPLHAAFQLRISASTSSNPEAHAGVAGESGLTARPMFSGLWQGGRLGVALNLGMLVREDKEIVRQRFSDELTYGLGIRVAVIEGLLDAHVEGFGATPLDDVGAGASSPLDLLSGIKLLLPHGLTVGLAGGAGVLRGYGSPDARAILSVALQTGVEQRPTRTQANHQDPLQEREPRQPSESREALDEVATQAPADEPADEPADVPEATSDDQEYGDVDHDGTLDLDDACPRLPGPEGARGCPKTLRLNAQTGELRLLSRLSFDAYKATLRPRSRAVLNDLVAALQADSSARIRFADHTRRGARGRSPQALSHERAQAVLSWFASRGYGERRVQALACGAARIGNNQGLGATGDRVQAWLIQPLPPNGMPSSLGCTLVSQAGGPSVTPPAAAPKPTDDRRLQPEPPAPVAPPDPDADGDGVRGALDQCPVAPGGAENGGCPRHIELHEGARTIGLLRPIKFSEGKARVRGRSKGMLEEVRALLRANPRMRLVVEGHASVAREGSLWAKRAERVRQELTADGIDPQRVHAVGCGDSRPVAPNTVAWGRKKNARIELHLLDPMPANGVTFAEGCQPSGSF